MAHLPEIRRIKTLERLGIFQNYTHDGSVPDFKRYNLIYGFNGTGKTTISRIFRGLDSGYLHTAVPPGGLFDLELSDGTRIALDKNPEALQNRILVFNSDFVDENLSWSDGRVNPVFYLGKDSSRRAELLERIERRIPARHEQRRNAQSVHDGKERALNTFYTDSARLIAEMLSLGRQYDARHLKSDYASDKINDYNALADQERDDRKKLISQANAYDKLSIPELDTQNLIAALQDGRGICETTITGLMLQEMQSHPSMIPWIKTGLDYHRDNSLQSCLFCGNDLTTERLGALQAVLDEHFDRFFTEIQAISERLRKSSDDLHQVPAALPNERSVTATLSRDYHEAIKELKGSLSSVEGILDRAVSAVESKAASPNKSNWPGILQDIESVNKAIQTLQVVHSNVVELIGKHNQEQEEFEQRQEMARDELKFAVLIEQSAEHKALCRQLTSAHDDLETRKRLYEKLRECAAALRNAVRDHGPAVEQINALLGAYLGHNEIELDSFEEGYRILRYGEVITGSLSEGERTAIALCYFLSKLQEEGRNLTQQIVVVDDPVSSLDAGSLNYAFNLLKSMLQDSQQLIILTHSLPFMNENKKWLRKLRDDGKASFFYVQSWHDKTRNRRQAKIREMPKLLRGYDSEYQYLFSLVKKCADDGAESEEIPGYIMPNVIRRVLELFLAFKIPSSEGLGDKINRPLVQGAGLELARIQALNRLTQLESHSDSLDDFIGFSAMTIEETHRAAESVLKLIENLDNDHYTRLCEICR